MTLDYPIGRRREIRTPKLSPLHFKCNVYTVPPFSDKRAISRPWTYSSRPPIRTQRPRYQSCELSRIGASPTFVLRLSHLDSLQLRQVYPISPLDKSPRHQQSVNFPHSMTYRRCIRSAVIYLPHLSGIERIYLSLSPRIVSMDLPFLISAAISSSIESTSASSNSSSSCLCKKAI